MAHAIHAPAAPHSLFDGLRRLLSEIKAKRARWALYSSTVSELESLTNRELADIGLSRGQIHSIAREHAFGAYAPMQRFV